MKEHVVANIITEPWWQLLTIILTALLTQFFTYVFLARQEKRRKIVEVATDLISTTSGIRNRLSTYKQSELHFEQTQGHLQASLKSKDDRIFNHTQQTVLLAHDGMLKAQTDYEETKLIFRRSAYLLRNMCYERLGNSKEFTKAVNTILDPKIGQHKDIESIKSEIIKKLDPSMKVIDSLCGEEIYLNTRSWRRFLLDTMSHLKNIRKSRR